MSKRRASKTPSDDDEFDDDNSTEEFQGDDDNTEPGAGLQLATGKTWQDEAGWTIVHPSIIYRDFGFVAPSVKIAAFDLDALINRKTTRLWPRDAGDWEWSNGGIPGKLASLAAQGFKVVIFSRIADKLGDGRPRVTHKQIIEDQIALVHQSIGMTTGGQAPPLQVFLAPSNISGDPYTKPATGMWTHMVENCNGDVQPDLSKSFHVGGGDSTFAADIGLTHHTPEEYFGPREASAAVVGATAAVEAEAHEAGRETAGG